MTGILKVDTLQRNDGTNHTIDTLGLSDGYRNNAGQIVARPQFMASGNWGAYNMAFTTAAQTSFTNTSSGYTTYPAFNSVTGGNTTGFTATSTPGNCKYRIPLTGTYMMSFKVLCNTDVSNHIDAAFLVTNTSDAFIANMPWSQQYLGDSVDSVGPCGFSRLQETDNIISSPGVTIIARLYEGQYIRPMIAMNTSATVQVYLSAHNFWHSAYLGK